MVMSIFQAKYNISWDIEEYFPAQIILISSAVLGMFL